jgi:DNA polymerase I
MEASRPRLLLLDGHSLAYRAFYALPVENFTTTSGQPTNLLYGFANMLANMLRDEDPTHVAVAFDSGRQTFRTEEFPEYKANRSRSPAEFSGQLAVLDELLAAMRVPAVRARGFEADDIIATLATRAAGDGFDVRIITGDRDALQLVTPDVTVLYFTRNTTEFTRCTPEQVQERYGLTPAQYPDFAALRGDPSDNLPSIPGIGEKTAAKWIREYGSLNALVERAGEVPGKAGEKLRAALPAVLLNRRLTELVRDVPLEVDLAELLRRPYDLEKFTPLLERLEFRNPSLRGRLFAADPGAGETVPEERAAPAVRLRGTLLGPGDVHGWLAARSGGLLGLAAAYSWSRGEGSAGRVALATPDSQAAVFETEALTEADERAFAAWLADPAKPKVVHDLKSLQLAFAEHGWQVMGVTTDPALVGYLLKPGITAYGLDELSAQYLNRHVRAADDPGALMAAASTALELAALLEERLAGTDMGPLLREVELPLSGLLAGAERVGVRVDQAMLTELEAQFAAGMRQCADEAAGIAGHEFNLGSTKQLNQVLFEELGLPRTKKIKSGYSTDADSLAWLAAKTGHDLPVILLRHRDLAGLRTTVAGLLREIGVDGRIHTTFTQTVAATGRITSTEPNLQVIPIRTREGRQIRRAFIPGEGFEALLTADYNQLELRVMAHLSQDPTLLEAFASGEDLHTTMAAQVFGVVPAQVTAEMRRKIKAMSYGLAYGLSAFGLAKQLGIRNEEARPLMDAYYARFGGVRDYLEQVVAQARKSGFTQTILGRRRYLPALTSDHRQRRETAERMALNAPIQGSAADLVKLAMLRVAAALTDAGLRSRLLLQVHDEFLLELAPGEHEQVSELVRVQMTTAYPLTVPLEVSIGTGPNWDIAAH